MMNKDELFLSIIFKCEINIIFIKIKVQKIPFMNTSSIWLKEIINSNLYYVVTMILGKKFHHTSKMVTTLNQMKLQY